MTAEAWVWIAIYIGTMIFCLYQKPGPTTTKFNKPITSKPETPRPRRIE